MEWLVKAKEDAGETAKSYSRSEIMNMLYSDEIRHSDFVKKPDNDEPWLPIYSVKEITAPMKSFLQGIRFFETKRFIRAMESFNNARRDPHLFALSSLFLGIIHSYRDNFERAINFYNECRDLEAFSFLIHNNLAVCYAYQGRPDEALKELLQIPAPRLSRFWISMVLRRWLDRLFPLRLPETRLEKIVRMNIHILKELPGASPFAYRGKKVVEKKEDSDSKEAENNKVDKQSETPVNNFRPPKINTYIEKQSFYSFMGIDRAISMISMIYDEYAMVIEPMLHAELRDFYRNAAPNEEMAIQSGRFSHGQDLYEAGDIQAARHIFQEMTSHEQLGPEAQRMIQQCDKKEENRLVEQYRTYKTDKKHDHAREILKVLKSRHPSTKLVNLDDEGDLIRELLDQQDIANASPWLDDEFNRLKDSYSNTLKKEEINIDEMASIKTNCERFLAKTQRFSASENEDLNKKKDDIGKLIDKCRNEIKITIENRLDESFKSNNDLDYIKKVIEYETRYQRLCKDVGLELNRHIEKVYERCDTLLNGLKLKGEKGYLRLENLMGFFGVLNNLFQIFPASNRLDRIIDDLVKMIFNNFLGSLKDSQIESILSFVKGEKRETWRGIYNLEKSLQRLENLQKRYRSKQDIGDLESILDSISNLAFNKGEIINKKVVNQLWSTATLFYNNQDFEHALIVLELLKSRLGIDDDRLKESIDRCRQIKERNFLAPFKKKLREIHDHYAKKANEASQGRMDGDEMSSLIDNFRSNYAKFEDFGDLLKETPGTSVSKWKEETRQYYNIIKAEYDRYLLAEVKKGTKVPKAIKYVRVHPEDFLENGEIMEIFQTILEKNPDDLNEDEKQLIKETGLSKKKFLDKLSAIVSCSDPIIAESLLDKFKKLKIPDALQRMVRHYVGKIKQESLKKRFDKSIELARLSNWDELVNILEELKKLIDDPVNEPYIDSSIERKFLDLKRKWVDDTVDTLKNSIGESDYEGANNLVMGLPESLRRDIEEDSHYVYNIRPAFILNKTSTVIDSCRGSIHFLGDTEICNLIQELNSIILKLPKEAGELKGMLWEEVNKDSHLMEEQKEKYRGLLDT